MRIILFYLLISVSFGVFAQQHVEFDKKNFPNDKEGFKVALKEFETGQHLYHQGEFQLKLLP